MRESHKPGVFTELGNLFISNWPWANWKHKERIKLYDRLTAPSQMNKAMDETT